MSFLFNFVTFLTILSYLMILVVTASPSSRSVSDTCNDCVCGVRGRTNRIVGGIVAPPHHFPWLAALQRQGKFYCGATIISRHHLLSAAHCVYAFDRNELRVYLGGHEISKDYEEIRRVRQIYVHEYFDAVSFNNDISVIEMDRAIQFGPNIKPVCLPSGDVKDFAGTVPIVAGWGKTMEKGIVSNVVRSVEVPVWTQEECNDAGYGANRLSENMMCGGYHDGGKDACQGDSGGGMILNGPTGSVELIGVVSWGRGCARPNLPGIYTRVVNFLPWIKKKIAGECLCSPKSGSSSQQTIGEVGERATNSHRRVTRPHQNHLFFEQFL